MSLDIESEPATDLKQISGKVILLYRASPSWCAGKIIVKYQEHSFTVKGFVSVGQPVTLAGRWVTSPKYGRQFEASEVIYTTPVDTAGLKTWLEWYCPNVGSVKAQKLIDEFGIRLVDMVSTDPQSVAIFAQIPIEAIHEIAKQWQEFAGKTACIAELSKLGLTQHQSELLWGRFKGSATTILREDPYLLLREVPGFGWKTVDELASKLGIPKNHHGRWRAAIVHTVAEANEKYGSTAIQQEMAIAKACDLCECPVEANQAGFEIAASDAAKIDQIRQVSDGKNFYCSTPASYAHEELIWKTFLTSRQPNPHIKNPDKLDDRIQYCGACGIERNEHPDIVRPCMACNSMDLVLRREIFIKGNRVVLDNDQSKAIDMILRNRISIITGNAGSGKTLIASAAAKLLTQEGIPIYLAAPTGKAARRLTETMGYEASTIHRLLAYQPMGGFGYNAHNQLPSGVYMVDEMSMVPSSLLYHLLSACGTNISIVFLGDPNQLASVEAGAVLRDVIENDLTPVAKLQTCHRQAGVLKFNSNQILKGIVEPSSLEDNPAPWMVHKSLQTPERVIAGVTKLFEEYLPKWGYDPVSEVQFLTAMHKGPLGTKHLNRICQWLRQRKIGNTLSEPKVGDEEKTTLYPKDKVMMTKNHYETGIMNGHQGIVVETTPDLVVDFDGKQIEFSREARGLVELAYVISVHKCVHPDTIVETDEGLLPIKMISKTGYIASPGGRNYYLNKIRNPVSKALKITTKHGYSITVTPEHKVETWIEGKYQMVLASKLYTKNWLRLCLGSTIEPKELASLPAGSEYVDVRAIRYKLPTEVNEEVAEFFGLMVGDGTIYGRGFRLVKRHKEVRDRFKELCESLFGIKARLMQINGTDGYECSSTHITNWLESVGGMNPNQKAVPESIMRSSSRIHAAFLRGLFEDGTANMKGTKCDHIELSTVYPGLAKMVQVMLLRLGIVCTSKIRKLGVRNSQPAHMIYIYGKNAERFKNSIGFISAFKSERLKEFCETEMKYMMPVTREEANSLRESCGVLTVQNARQYKTVSRQTAIKAGWIDRLDWFEDYIVSIEEVECESMCVEVPDGHKFYQNGFPFGNSQGSQWPCLVYICPKQHSFMSNRNLFYTAVTRASKTAIIMGDEDGIRRAADRVDDSRRTTLLQLFSRSEQARPK